MFKLLTAAYDAVTGGFFGWKVVAVVAAIAFCSGGVGGGWLMHRIMDDSVARAEVSMLKKQLKARDAADRVNTELADKATKQRDALQEQVDALKGQISSGMCFTGADVDRLRQLWGR